MPFFITGGTGQAAWLEEPPGGSTIWRRLRRARGLLAPLTFAAGAVALVAAAIVASAASC